MFSTEAKDDRQVEDNERIDSDEVHNCHEEQDIFG